jgi:hypothetical protein
MNVSGSLAVVAWVGLVNGLCGRFISPEVVLFFIVAIGNWLLAIGCWLLAVGCWLLAVGCCLLAIGYWLLAIEEKHGVWH